MAISSYKTFLMEGTGSGTLTWAKLLDIKDYPDLGGEPDNLETTTLSDGAHTYIPGIENQDAMAFTANYDGATFNTLKGKKGTELNLAVWFGATVAGGVATPTGSDGKFEFKGYIDVYVSGKGVNEVVDMIVTVTPSSVINFTLPSA